MDHTVVDMEPECGADQVETEFSCGARIEHQHSALFVVDNLEDMGVAADEDVGTVGFDKAESVEVVSAGIATDVHHQDFFPFDIHQLDVRMHLADILSVAVAVNPLEGLECRYRVRGFDVAEIAGVPDLVHGLEEPPERLVEEAVSV